MTGAHSPRAARVLVVDDHPVVRRGLVALLTSLPWVEAPLEAASVSEARRVATTERPSLAVVDVGLPDGDGIELVAQLDRLSPGCRCLVLTMDTSQATAQRALAAGAAGHLAKDASPELVVEALTTIAAGGMVLGYASVAGRVRLGEPGEAAESGGTADLGPFAALTARELDVARAVARGDSNGRAARRLGISEKTVRNVLSGLLPKVGARDRVHLVLLARERGLGG